MNWACPIHEDEIWDDPFAALTHIWERGGRHGSPQSLVVETREGREILWPQVTSEDTTEETGEEYLREYLSHTFDRETSQMIRELEEGGIELISDLSRESHREMSLVRHHQGFINDLTKIERDLDEIDSVLSLILREWDDITGDEVVEEVVSESEEDETEDSDPKPPSGVMTSQNTGRYTTEEVMEREEDEVFDLLETSTLLDDYTDGILETFRYVYRRREEDGVGIDEVATGIGVPNGLAEDNLDTLSEELNMIQHDKTRDVFYVPY